MTGQWNHPEPTLAMERLCSEAFQWRLLRSGCRQASVWLGDHDRGGGAIKVVDVSQRASRSRHLGLKATAIVLSALAMMTAPPDGHGSTDTASATHTSARSVDAPDEASALEQARASGQRVEVAPARSETKQIFAEADGTLTAEVSLQPLRVHRADGSWVAPDTTLQFQHDGSLAPVATTVDLRFSGVGSSAGTTLATISRDGASLAMAWSRPLPKAEVSGDTATYPGAMPGVDLRVQAHVDGFSEQLVVKRPDESGGDQQAA